MKLNLVIGILFLIFVSCKVVQETTESEVDFQGYSEVIGESNQRIDLVPISGGTFTMGSNDGQANEGPAQEVSVESFWMGAYEITWDQYELFVNDELSGLSNIKSTSGDIEVDAISTPTPMYIDMSFGMGKEGYPAVNMTHYAAVMFAKWLSAKTGHFYRLPTEAEWEYAARAGSEGAYYFGDDASELGNYAWFEENSDGGYEKVGTKQPNAWGLYDMLGNVAEWTTDQYFEDYHEKLEGKPAENPWFKPTTLYPRTVRGGSWKDGATAVQTTSREGSNKIWKQRDPQMPKSIWWLTDAPFVGFRLVRPLETPSEEEMQEYWVKVMQDF